MKALRASGVGAILSLLIALTGRSAPARAQAPAPDAEAPPSAQSPAAAAPAPAPVVHAPAASPPVPVAPAPPEDEAAPAVPPDENPPDSTSSEDHRALPTTSNEGQVELSPPVETPPPEDILEGESQPIRYYLEHVRVRGNTTRSRLVRHFVPIETGELFDVDDPSLERLRWRLMGTGWFETVNFHLERGSRRGWVELVIVVEERNTLVISRVVAGLARVVTRSTDQADSLRPYGGLGVTETNLAGLGIGVGGSAVVSEDQFGLEATYLDPMFRDTSFRFMGRAFFNHAREFFGRNPMVAINCPPRDPDDPEDECDPDIVAQRAVVIYDRAGVSVGTGHDISSTLRYEVDWLGELVQVDTLPAIASTERGDEVAPIDFRIDDDRSYVSSLGFTLLWDRRDDPALPSRGQTASLQARFASSLFASTYDFARFEAGIRHWQPLPWGHVLSLGAYAGMVMGRAPFFYHFYAADLSDLLPSRVLGLNLDHRRTHNLLGTSVIEFDKAEIAGRLDFEYSLPLHRGRGGVRGFDAYAGAGVFMLAEREALRTGIQGYEGFERVPIDLTFDIGVQADTTIGLFKVGFSSFIGFLPDLGRE